MDVIRDALQTAISRLKAEQILPPDYDARIQLERTRDPAHGDFACNAALGMARQARRKPRELAELLVERLPKLDLVRNIEIAGPGFINFFLAGDHHAETLRRVISQGQQYGRKQLEAPQRIHIEFVSANPTGPLHVGHGRGAAYGAALASLLQAVGHEVHREYYVNDMGRQMDILAASVWVRALQQQGHELPFPVNAYQGEYVSEIAAQLCKQKPFELTLPELGRLPEDGEDKQLKEAYIDALIQLGRDHLGSDRFLEILEFALQLILTDIRDDLSGFRVEYDEWFSERGLNSSGRIQMQMDRLAEGGYLYEKDGALWFRSTGFGDDKDRVLRRENGQTTYFASDVAYHLDKFERGFDRCINIWGADHHGYIARVQAALSGLKLNPDKLQIQLVQFANLYRGGAKVTMSTRSGSFITLRELREDVGDDAARFFYVMRKSDQHMDFDLDLARSQSKDNPVYYVQYAHARVCSMLEKLTEQGLSLDTENGIASVAKLTEAPEQELLTRLGDFPALLLRAAEQAHPHLLTTYLRELAASFHSWYNAHRVLVEDPGLRDARLALSVAVRSVIANGLHILGVSAPQRM